MLHSDEIREIARQLRVRAGSGSHLRIDSRTIQPGDVFVALKGAKTDGLSYVPVAQARGASAVLCEDRPDVFPAQSPLECFPVKDLRRCLGLIASEFYERPSEKMLGIAITGTNGKTSISHWISRLLTDCGIPCAAIGTIGCFFGKKAIPSPPLTTPDAASVQGLYYDISEIGSKAFAIEASSIGLEQGRLNGSNFRVAVFTNLTRDHLDYHKTFEAYEAAKAILFHWPTLECAISNLNDPVGVRMLKIAEERGIKTIGYGIGNTNLDQAFRKGDFESLIASDVQSDVDGMRFNVTYRESRISLKVKALGLFNVFNLLAVAATALACGVPQDKVFERLQLLEAPKGRLQMVTRDGMPLCVVDYCHTPDAIEKALDALKSVRDARQGKIWIVLGAGGDRDPGKRPMMGRVAGRLADRVVVTSDNPRTEDPLLIAQAVLGGVEDRSKARLIVDRREAIHETVCEADRRDVILIAGKGHEDYQEVMGEKHHFSDAEVTEEAFNERFVRSNQ